MAVNVTLVVGCLSVNVNPIRKSLIKSFNHFLKVFIIMCLNPIYIPNKSKQRYGGLPYVSVPCRNCPECAAVMQTDYLVRTIALCNSLPDYYSFFFCTLTFDNDNLPLTNVYIRDSDNNWRVIKHNVPTFNHQLYKRFRKNFTEYCLDSFGSKLYLLTTSEFGEKKHRPHYHCFCAFPALVNWKTFKSIIERFWHYGFTKNIQIVNVDGQFHDRSLLNSIKYVTKYICKYNRWMPFYLKDSFCTDFPPYDIKPKTFCSNGYGQALESFLTDSNYVYNSVFLQLKGVQSDLGREYQLPSYYRRRYFTTNVVYEKESVIIDSKFPYSDKLKNRNHFHTKSFVLRSSQYQKTLFEDFKSKLKDKIEKCQLAFNTSDFKNYLKLKFDGIIPSFNLSVAFDKLVNIYLERQIPLYSFFSFLSQSKCYAIPYKNMIEKISKSHFIIPDNVAPWYALDKIRAAKHEKSTYELPWLPLGDGIRESVYKICDYVPYSEMPFEWHILQLYDVYHRNKLRMQYERRERVQSSWLQVHVAPYIDVA